MKIDSLSVSQQISFEEYKKYLEAIKKDSSTIFYLSQLPDSSITSKENYSKYLADEKYNTFPVVGVTWEAAMNFCKWKTLNESENGKIKYIYRLPKISEWVDAYNYMESGRYPNDFSKNYSDWTLNLYYEGAYGFKADSTFFYDIIYFGKRDDSPGDKRIRIIGNSYLFQRQALMPAGFGFTFNGYRQVCFRVVREHINKETAFEKNIFKYWGLLSTD